MMDAVNDKGREALDGTTEKTIPAKKPPLRARCLPGDPDCRLTVQFDRIDIEERGCAALAEEARRAGADFVQLERCDFYLDGEAREKALAALAGHIRFFEEAGFPVVLWRRFLPAVSTAQLFFCHETSNHNR